ncbi:MAG TPA: HAD-IIB family hydrolase [Anaerovoracaceae bacterium]|nr:HAD-IIB family hydrolase [Anaerovoracaceae bacterium]
MKKLIIFDLDGTLAESKSPMTLDMAELLESLLQRFSVAIISGGAYAQFEKQFLGSLPLPDEQLRNLYLFPTCATSFYRYDTKWNRIYSEDLTEEQRTLILNAFEKAFIDVGFDVPDRPQHGPILEDRGTQITFSALGQSAPVHLKKKWDPHHLKRLNLISYLMKYIPEFEIRTGGSTSIDVTKKNIDKAYGIQQMEKYLNFKPADMLFVGDALFAGGNDYAVKLAGVECIETSGPEETMRIIQKIIDDHDRATQVS